MHKIDAFDNLSGDDRGCFFWEIIGGQHIIEMTLSSKLDEEVYPSLVAEKVIELNQIRMSKIGLDFNFVC